MKTLIFCIAYAIVVAIATAVCYFGANSDTFRSAFQKRFETDFIYMTKQDIPAIFFALVISLPFLILWIIFSEIRKFVKKCIGK